jgi:hypothetical protein
VEEMAVTPAVTFSVVTEEDLRPDAHRHPGDPSDERVLDRLLELNHERYAAEVAAGLHDKGVKARKRTVQEQEGEALF